MVLPFRLAVDEPDLPHDQGDLLEEPGCFRLVTGAEPASAGWRMSGSRRDRIVRALRPYGTFSQNRPRRPRRDVFKGKHQTEGKLMRIFVTGATGALGRHLVPGLVAAGHEVTATTRTPSKVAQLRAAGAEPVILDGLDREAVIAAV